MTTLLIRRSIDPLRASELRRVASGAWLQSREERCAGECVIVELLLQQRELGVIPRSQLTTKRFTDHDSIAGHNCSDLRTDLTWLAFAFASKRDRALHERSIY